MKVEPRRLLAASVGVLFSLFLGTAGAGDVRSFVAGNFFLELDGVKTGFLKSAEGGGATADVVEEQAGSDRIVRKHIAQPKYEDITIQLGFSNGKPIYDWIAASLRQQFQRKNGSIIAADFRFRAMSELQFFNALITEFTIPTLDAADHDAGFLTLKFAPELTRTVQASGALPFPQRARPWRPANFRLVIDGLDTSRVTKIDAFTIKQQIVEFLPGEQRDPRKEPGKLEIPNLKITFAQSSAQSWIAWHEDFVIKGNNGNDREKSGRIEFLSPDLKTVLGQINLFNVGIFALGPAKAVPNPCQSGCPADPTDVVGKMQAALYVERMEFEAAGTDVPQ